MKFYKKNSKLELIVGYFPKLKSEDMQKISLWFCSFGFDFINRIDCLNFIKDRLEKNA